MWLTCHFAILCSLLPSRLFLASFTLNFYKEQAVLSQRPVLSYKSTSPVQIFFLPVWQLLLFYIQVRNKTQMYFSLLLLCYFNQGVSAFLQHWFVNTLLPCLAAFKVVAEELVSHCLGGTTGLSWLHSSTDPSSCVSVCYWPAAISTKQAEGECVYLAGSCHKLLFFLPGSLAVSVADMTAPVVGSSGGVYALVSAHLANIVMVSTKMTVTSLEARQFWWPKGAGNRAWPSSWSFGVYPSQESLWPWNGNMTLWLVAWLLWRLAACKENPKI